MTTMNRWSRLAVALAVVASSAGGGVAWAARSEDPAIFQEVVPVAKALGAGTTETEFVAIAPCRLVDTRFGTPAPDVGAERGVAVRGNGAPFAAQGGTAPGCKIPFGATAIEATVTAVVPTGSGYLRAYPGAPAGATFLNYTRGESDTNTGAIALCTIGCQPNFDLRYKLFTNRTDVIIDVQGYYVPPLAALVESSGTLLRGSRVATERTAVGAYKATFDRDVSMCVYVTSSYLTTVVVTAQGVSQGVVAVQTRTPDGEATDARFSLEVIC